MRISPEEAVDVAVRESADVIGVSLLSGAHKPLMDKLMRAVDEREMRGEALIMLGGTIPDADVDELNEMGIDGVFPVGSSLRDIERFIRERLADKARD
jgi:methylmalonyl-CoA mutase, C-terminal domain